MGPGPGPAVGVQVEQVPGGQRQAVEIMDRAARAGGRQLARTRQDQARHSIGGPGTVFPKAHELGQGHLTFAQRNGIGAGGEIDGRVVGDVRSVHRDPAASRLRRRDHGQGAVPAVAGAHLGQEVEVVLHDHHDTGPMPVERDFELLNPQGKGGVK